MSDVRVTSCFADFDQQNGFTGIAATGAVLRLRSIDLRLRLRFMRAMSHEYVYKISSRYLQEWLRYNIKHVKKEALFTSFRDFTVIFRILFFDRF